MKKVILLSALFSFSLSAMAYQEESRQVCFDKATKAVKQQAQMTYDKNGIETVNCIQPLNKYVVTCNVVASKGDGAATDSYYVILNRDCTKVHRVELVGEE